MTCPAFIKDDEVAEDDNSDARASGRPNNHSFMFENAEQWTDAPLDLSALPDNVTQLPGSVKFDIRSLKVELTCHLRYQNNP